MSEVIDLLSKLVSIGSINPMGRDLTGEGVLETEMGNYLEKWFQAEGIPCKRQPVHPGRDNIIATFKGNSRTILLEAHMDVVPVDNMVIEPFNPVIKDGRIYGRGSCDTKAGMAGMMTAIKRLKNEDPENAPTVILACVVDEEHQFTGISEACKQGIQADMAIVAEPTELEIVVSHKGVIRWKISTDGVSAHSANLDDGISAIERMTHVIQELERYHATVLKKKTNPLLGTASLSIGRITGGSSVNTVPNYCEIEIDRRVLPEEDPIEGIRELEQWLKENSGFEFDVKFHHPWVISQPLAKTENETVIQLLSESCDHILGKHQTTSVPYGTDASVIAREEIPVVIFGAGSIDQAHSKDEWISIQEVEQATEIFYDFLVRAGKNSSPKT